MNRGELIDYLRQYERAAGPGMSVCVRQKDAEPFLWQAGLADLDHNMPIGAGTRFHVASVSKQFTGYAIALLERDGQLRLDDDVREYLPYLANCTPAITLEMMLRHCSGLPDEWALFAMSGTSLDNLIKQDDLVALARRLRPTNFQPGTGFQYCNTGYSLLAEVVRVASGQSLRGFLKDRVFDPLGMAGSFILDDAGEVVAGRPQSYRRAADGTWRLTRLNFANYGSTGLWSTAADLGEWGAYLGRCRCDDPDLYRRFTEPGSLADGRRVTYGLGLTVGHRAGRAALFHSGLDASFLADFVHIPDADLTVAVLANTSAVSPGLIAEGLADRALKASAAPTSVEKVEAPDWAEGLVGTFVSPAGSMITIEKAGDRFALSRPGFDLPPSPLPSIHFRSNGHFDIGMPWGTSYEPEVIPGGHVERIVQHSTTASSISYRRLEPFCCDPAGLRAYCGTFRSAMLDRTYEITVDQHRLSARLVTGSEVIVCSPTAPHCFNADRWYMTRLIFDVDDGGVATGFTVNAFRANGIYFARQD